MQEPHERLGPRSPISWRARVIVLAVMTISYGALFYGIAHTRAPWDSIADGPPLFTPVVSKAGEQRGGMTNAKPSRSEEKFKAQEQSTPPPRHWTYPPIDLLPSAPGWAATVSDLTPITNAESDPPEKQTPLLEDSSAAGPELAKSNLQMVRWFRPVYTRDQCTSLRADGPLVLDLLINPDGRPVEIKIAQSSGSPQLDTMALHAAGLWRFAPPLWRSRPVEVWGRVELRFNC